MITERQVVKFARALDALRIFPRVFIGLYLYLLYRSVEWFMMLPSPNAEQAALISVMTAIGAPWFSAYVNSGPKMQGMAVPEKPPVVSDDQ